MPLNINEFTAQLKAGGARSSLFEVYLTNPVNTSGDVILPYRCRAASLPARNINPVITSYFGRQVKFPGVVNNYDDWTVTIIEDESFVVRNALEEWSHIINSPIGNKREAASSDASLVKSVASVTALSQTNQPLRTYKFSGIYPVSIGEITTDWSNEAIMEYTVTFSVDYWEIDNNSATGLAGGPNL